jgi:hypothetical protein
MPALTGFSLRQPPASDFGVTGGVAMVVIGGIDLGDDSDAGGPAGVNRLARRSEANLPPGP